SGGADLPGGVRPADRLAAVRPFRGAGSGPPGRRLAAAGRGAGGGGGGDGTAAGAARLMACGGTARAGNLALAGVLAFLLAAAAVHVIRGDLDWVHAQMSLYLVGPGGRLLQAGYCAMAGALVLLATGLRG